MSKNIRELRIAGEFEDILNPSIAQWFRAPGCRLQQSKADIPLRKLNEAPKAKSSDRTREIPSSILGGGIFFKIYS